MFSAGDCLDFWEEKGGGSVFGFIKATLIYSSFYLYRTPCYETWDSIHTNTATPYLWFRFLWFQLLCGQKCEDTKWKILEVSNC